jgi:hypothetical protein
MSGITSQNKIPPYGGLLFLLLLCKNQPFVIIMTNKLWDNGHRLWLGVQQTQAFECVAYPVTQVVSAETLIFGDLKWLLLIVF